MSSSCDLRPRGQVLRARNAAPAVLDTELAAAASALDALDPARVAALTDEARRLGHQEGFAAGAAEGRAAGFAASASEIDALLASLTRAADALGAAAAALGETQAVELEAVEDDLVGAALTIAEAVIGRELALAVDPGREALSRALALVPPATAVVARLHPVDVATLDAHADLGGRSVEIVSDPSVEPGGCVADAGDARIDAQLGAALARVADRLGAVAR